VYTLLLRWNQSRHSNWRLWMEL